MRSTYKQFYYINRGRVKADGTTSIFCRITIDGKVSAIATGLYCAPEEWDTKKGEAKNARVNGQLQAFRLRIDEAYEQATKEKGIVTAEILKNVIVDANTIPMTLLATGEEERESLRLRSIRINSTSSYRQSKTSQLNLREFIGLRGMNDIAFEDLTEEFGKSYKLFLIGKGYSASNTNHNLCWLQRLVYIAVDRGLLKFNPLEDVGYEKKGSPKRRHISRNDLLLIMETPMEDKALELARRMFVFSSLTGLAYVDLRNLYPHHIGMTADGRKYIREKRAKTNNEAFIPLHPIAEQIMSLYNTADDSKPVFPLSSRDSMWFEFHSLGVALGINENLTAHVARHTFGVNMVTSGISMESIAKMMGHSNLRSTQVYAVITDDKISKDMDKLMQRRETKETDQNKIRRTKMNRGVITISESGTVSMPTDTVWMTMQEIADMYNVFGCYVRKAVKTVFKDGILKEQGVRRHVSKNDRISYDVYSLELVIAVAFRIDSIESRAFREFIMQSVIGKQTSRTKLVCIFTENAMA